MCLPHFTTDSEDFWEEFTMRHLSEGCYIGFLRWKTMEQQLNVNIWLPGAAVFLSMMFTFDTLSSFIWHELNYVFIGGWTPQADEEWGGSRCLEMSIQVAGKSRQQERCNMRGTCYAESFEASRARSLDFRRLGLKSPGRMDWSAKILRWMDDRSPVLVFQHSYHSCEFLSADLKNDFILPLFTLFMSAGEELRQSMSLQKMSTSGLQISIPRWWAHFCPRWGHLLEDPVMQAAFLWGSFSCFPIWLLWLLWPFASFACWFLMFFLTVSLGFLVFCCFFWLWLLWFPGSMQQLY